MTSRSAIQFLLGRERRVLSDVPPTTTVLEYLRTVEGLRGTKEGCGEGDCGACTVVLGEVTDGEIAYRAVNACIQFVPTLDGRQLLTVEHLADGADALHPAQAAIVESHGSQCGFCTPGFVMSLFALGRTEESFDRDRVNNALAGNLCRCTGYGTIVEAARRMIEGGEARHFRLADQETVRILTGMNDGADIDLSVGTQRFFAPASGDALARIYADHPDAVIVSGGTDVGLWVTKLGRELDTIIYTGRARDLRRIDHENGRIVVWAGATHADLLPVAARFYPEFAELLRRFGSPQVRNVGTLCGNVANGSPIGDTLPVLIALGARITLRLGDERREIAIDDYFIDYRKQDRRPGEFVEKVSFPMPDSGHIFAVYKVSKRFDQDISAVCGAFNLRIDNARVVDARIAYGGMAATPKRARNAEQAIIGKAWAKDAAWAAMEALERDFRPISDMRASAGYRLRVARNLMNKFFLETTTGDAPLRLVNGGSLIDASR